jgi:hypothetical protein
LKALVLVPFCDFPAITFERIIPVAFFLCIAFIQLVEALCSLDGMIILMANDIHYVNQFGTIVDEHDDAVVRGIIHPRHDRVLIITN